MKRSISGLLALGIAAAIAVTVTKAPLSAQTKPIESIDQTAHLSSVNMKSVLPALEVVTGNTIASVDEAGATKIIATATNGLRFEVFFRACDEVTDDTAEQHCKAIIMMSVWDPPADGQTAQLDSMIDDFLRDYPASNAGRFENGNPYLVRYLISDHGVIQGNLLSEFSNFIRSATDYQNNIAPLYSN